MTSALMATYSQGSGPPTQVYNPQSYGIRLLRCPTDIAAIKILVAHDSVREDRLRTECFCSTDNPGSKYVLTRRYASVLLN
ncbi:hypothetical protein N7456_001763 [Penicillium angulare]|uniref:Uncharacterized protein n=1 Tax=Penicillium angulare TaxID=116970 RepID=A0A9W9G6T3_9EURO|nr:hypothetical protein N7456_001763 [Penicillium angulare]